MPRPAITPERLRRLPIFPLPNAVLIPGGYLPLHVFEHRYCSMISDCLADDRVLAVPLLAPDAGAAGQQAPSLRPRVHRTAGLGYIEVVQPLEGGESNIVLKGTTRVRILEEVPSDRPYRLVRAEPLQESQGPREEQAISVRVLRQLARQLLGLLPDELGQQMSVAISEVQDPGGLADLVGAAVLLDPTQRQSFLEELDVPRRLGLTTHVVAGLLAKLHDATGKRMVN